MNGIIDALGAGLAATTFFIGFSSLRLRAERDRALTRSDSVVGELTRAGAVNRVVTDGEVGTAAQALSQAERKDPIGKWTLAFTFATCLLMLVLSIRVGAASGGAFTLNPSRWADDTLSVLFFLTVEAGLIWLGVADYRWVGRDIDRKLADSVVSIAAEAIRCQKSKDSKAALGLLDDVAMRTPSWPWVHAFRAHVLSSMNREAEALTAITRALSLDERNPWWRVVRAELYLNSKRYSDALAELNDASLESLDPGSVAPLRGAALYGLGRRAEALAAFDRAVGSNPSDLDRRMDRGRALLGNGEEGHDGTPSAMLIDMLLNNGERVALRTVSAVGRDSLQGRDAASAIADFDFVIKANPTDASAHVWRAIAKYNLKDAIGGDADFDRAMQLGASPRRVHISRGNALRRVGIFSGAETAYSAALAIKATAPIYMARAFMRGRQGNNKGAVEDFRRAMSLDTASIDSTVHLAEALAYLGETEESDTLFEQARDRDPQVAHTYAVWINTLLLTKRAGEAEAVIESALNSGFTDQDRMRMLALAGSVYSKLRLYRKALDTFDEADRLEPGSPEVAYRRSLCLLDKGDTDSAIQAMSPATSSSWYLQAAALATRSAQYRKAGHHNEALEDISKAISMEPENDRFRISRASLHIVAADLDAAMSDINTAVRLNTKSAIAIAHRHQLHELKGDHASAAADLSTLTEMVGLDHPLTIQAEASAYFAHEDWVEAARSYRKLLAIESSPDILFNLAASYVNNSQFEDAEEVFEILVRDSPGTPSRGGLAVAVSAQGRSNEAAELFRDLRKHSHQEAEEWIASLKPTVLPKYEQVMEDWAKSA